MIGCRMEKERNNVVNAGMAPRDDKRLFIPHKAEMLVLAHQKTWGLTLELKRDVRMLFPFINAVFKGARYSDGPEHIRFFFDKAACTLHPLELAAAPFQSREQAMRFMARLSSQLNRLHRDCLNIEPNYRRHRSSSVLDMLRLLPRSNCRVCGYATCLAFASALTVSRAAPWSCPYLMRPSSREIYYRVQDAPAPPDSTVALTFSGYEPADAPQPPRSTLSTREIQVLRLAAEGADNELISESLGISPNTVKRHLVNIFGKLGIKNRTEAAVWAARQGII